MIHVDNISKRYRTGTLGFGTLSHSIMDMLRITGNSDHQYSWVLRGLTLHVGSGEAVGVIGANGSGKTTLLSIIAGVTRPTEGSVKVKGTVGMILGANIGTSPELPAKSNVLFHGEMLGMSKEEVRGKLDEIVEFAGVTESLNKPMKHFSSGMVVRLGLSIALHMDTSILLVDEALSQADADFHNKCLERIEYKVGCGTTLIIVSHSMDTIRRMAKRAVWLDRGVVAHDGDTEEGIDKYMNYAAEKLKRRWGDNGSTYYRLDESR